MNAHELARCLLAGPDLPVATHANNHTYMSGIHSPDLLRIARLHTYGGEHVLIGNPYKADLNSPNWYITEWFDPADEERFGLEVRTPMSVVEGWRRGE